MASIKRKPEIQDEINKDQALVDLYKKSNPNWNKSEEGRADELAKVVASQVDI